MRRGSLLTLALLLAGALSVWAQTPWSTASSARAGGRADGQTVTLSGSRTAESS